MNAGEFPGMSVGGFPAGLHISDVVAHLQGVRDDKACGGATRRIDGQPLLLWSAGDAYPDNANDLLHHDQDPSTAGDSNVGINLPWK